MNFGRILGSCSMAHADKHAKLWSDWLLVRAVVNLIGQCDYSISLEMHTASIGMVYYSCGKLVMWPCQSCNLIGTWKFKVHPTLSPPRGWGLGTRFILTFSPRESTDLVKPSITEFNASKCSHSIHSPAVCVCVCVCEWVCVYTC